MIEKEAHQELADTHDSANAIRKQADTDAKRMIADAKDASDRILDDAREDSGQLVSDAQREAVDLVLAAERKAAVRTAPDIDALAQPQRALPASTSNGGGNGAS